MPKRVRLSGRFTEWVVGAVAAATPLAGCAVGPVGARTGLEGLERRSEGVRVGERDIDVSSLRLAGEGAGRVVLVHGTPGRAKDWSTLLRRVGGVHDWIAVDRPGFGDTMPREAVASLSEHADAIAGLIGPVGCGPDGEGVILVGHSYGGPVVVRVAIDYPERVAGLVLVAAALDPDLERVRWYQRVGDWPVVSWALPSFLRNTNRELIALESELRELEPRLGEIEVPVVIVHGVRDGLVPYENVAYMTERFGGVTSVRVETLSDAGHMIPWRRPEAIIDAVRAVSDRAWGGRPGPPGTGG